MGAELSTAIRGHKMSPECASFCECFEPYCHKDDISTHARATQFAILDGNHNGHASLAECMKWIQDTLNSKCPERGPDLFRYIYILLSMTVISKYDVIIIIIITFSLFYKNRWNFYKYSSLLTKIDSYSLAV